MIEATYAINEKIKSVLATAGYAYEFYPGDFAPDGAADSFFLFKTIPNVGVDMFYLHLDTIKYKIYNVSFDALHKTITTISNLINVENIQWTPVFTEPFIHFKDAHFSVSNSAQSVYLEGNNYHYASCELSIIYTEN